MFLIHFMSFSFCQNVIIYIIVYANHSLSPEIVKVLCFLQGSGCGDQIMDKPTEKNGAHFSDVIIAGHLFSLVLSVICPCQEYAK